MKKVLKITFVIIIVFILCYGIILGVDCIRVNNLKEPFFILGKYEETGLIEYNGLGYKTLVKYGFVDDKKVIEEIKISMFGKTIAAAVACYGTNYGGTSKTDIKQEVENKRLVMIDGSLYEDTGFESKITGRCGVMDGEITSNVDIDQIPNVDGTSNFEGKYGYQYVNKDTIELAIDGKWIVFKKVGTENTFYAEVLEVYDNSIIVKPYASEPILNVADKISMAVDDSNLYKVGARLKIIYTGEIMESYPAQIVSKEIQIIK